MENLIFSDINKHYRTLKGSSRYTGNIERETKNVHKQTKTTTQNYKDDQHGPHHIPSSIILAQLYKFYTITQNMKLRKIRNSTCKEVYCVL